MGGSPDPVVIADNRPPLPRRISQPRAEASPVSGNDIILLSCFDGIATAAHVLTQMFGTLFLFVAWEVDPECLLITKRHFPQVVARGDFMSDPAADVVSLVSEYDPQGKKLILFVGAPPCPDFSAIRPDAPGRSGPEGQKFSHYCTWCREVESGLPHHRVGYLVENVILQDRGEADFFSNALGCQTVAVDASDFGLISRPRLWWSRVDWHTVNSYPGSAKPLRWTKLHKFPRLHVDCDLQHASSLDLDGKHLDPRVQRHELCVPCLTTPSPSASGRAAPKRMKGKLDPYTKTRWLEDHRTYAPWQYEPHALLHDDQGNMQVPTAECKEQLHMLPKGYTAIDGVHDRSRHRVLANGWHCGVARFLFQFVLGAMVTGSASTTLKPPPRQSTLQWLEQLMRVQTAHVGPGFWPTQPICVAPSRDIWDHWHNATTADHPLHFPAKIAPGFVQCLKFQFDWRHDLVRIREELAVEIHTMVDEWADHTHDWWLKLRPHIQQVYWNPDTKVITQIPVLLHLLGRFGFPGLPELADDLCNGFAMTGQLHGGSGWAPRTDDKYASPLSMPRFKELNRHYILQRLNHPRIDKHADTMLKELIEELRLGRMGGPFLAPTWWPCNTAELPDRYNIPLPDDEISASFCFSVEQSDKIRRCEDFKHSFLNSTVCVHDTPHHDDLSVFVELIRAHFDLQIQAQAWAQDLDGAYRQFPLRDPRDGFCILQLGSGPLLLQHHALSFGAVSSVWGFNRAADALCFLARRIFQICVGHFVDDFVGIENSQTIHSGFDAFSAVFRCFGLNMKDKKSLAPSSHQKILGVMVHIRDSDIVLSPHPDRLEKLRNALLKIQTQQFLSVQEAQRIAGKLVFLTSSLFGQLGKSAIHPFYVFAHSGAKDVHHDALPVAMNCAIRTLLMLFDALQPRLISTRVLSRPGVLYTDAFFKKGDHTFSAGHCCPTGLWAKSRCHQFENGWGFVCHIYHHTVFAAGSVPPRVLRAFCERRAFIYFLEIVAQLIAMAVLRNHFPALIIALIDNQAGLSGLLKGYGKDSCINNLLAFIWRLICHFGWNIHFEWVPSSLNMSDSVSRFDFSDMTALKATRVHFNLDPLWKILIRVANDLEYAHSSALDDLLLQLPASDLTFQCTGSVG